MEKLLAKAKPQLVPALALGASAGIRSEEIKRLHWENIKFKQGHIGINSAHSKTTIRSLISVQKNLSEASVHFDGATPDPWAIEVELDVRMIGQQGHRHRRVS